MYIYIYTVEVYVRICVYIYVYFYIYIHFPVTFERFMKPHSLLALPASIFHGEIPNSGGSGGILALGDPWIFFGFWVY